MKAEIFYKDKHDHSVEYNAIGEDSLYCILRAQVIPSLPTKDLKNNPDHDVWVALAKVTGEVNSAWCSCTAG